MTDPYFGLYNTLIYLLGQEIKFSKVFFFHFLIFMIICLNARNQENLLSGSREKYITDEWIQEFTERSKNTCDKLKLQPLFILQDLQLNSSGSAKRSKQAKKIKESRGVWRMLGTFIWWYLTVFPKPLLGEFWQVKRKHSIRFWRFFRRPRFPFLFCTFDLLVTFFRKFQCYYHDIEQGLLMSHGLTR